MSSSKNTPNTSPYYKEICQIGGIFIVLLISRPQDESLSMVRSHVDFYRHKQNQLSKLAIQALPSVTSPPQDEKCHICLEKFVSGKEVKEMKCKHLFHKDCLVEKVLRVKAIAMCPICGEKVSVRTDKVVGEDMDWDKMDDDFFKRFKVMFKLVQDIF